MAVLGFPKLDILQLAITSGLVPEEIAQAPAEFGVSAVGEWWVKFDQALPRGAMNELSALGVNKGRSAPLPLDRNVACWPQLLPLVKDTRGIQQNDKTTVLFELDALQELPELAAEILRLGNDRQAFRWQMTDDGSLRALLRVIGPPYYSLLRAVEGKLWQASAQPTRAYVEQAARVWVAVGYTHPLISRLKPPAGRMLLLRPPHDWQWLDEARYRDLYEVLDFQLPSPAATWQEAELPHRLTVPMRLIRAGGNDLDELWVLQNSQLEVLDEFVQSADDRLLSRLAFAVVQHGEQQEIVLRVRPSKQPPPVLVLPATGYRSFLKMPNLFVPTGTRLHPPLRRDAVKQLLAENTQLVTWLEPGEKGQFFPKQVAETAFRPLEDWVDYVLDHEQQALSAWMQSNQFDFQSFVCSDDPRSERTRKKGERNKDELDQPIEIDDTPEEHPSLLKRVLKRFKKREGSDDSFELLAQAPPTELQIRLRELETEFLALTTRPDDDHRQELWREMALVNATLNHATDSAICWMNALWEDHSPDNTWWHAWLLVETRGKYPTGLDSEDLDLLLGDANPIPSQLHLLAAFLCDTAHSEQPAAWVSSRLGAVQNFLERHDNLLPIRGVWLAWLAVARLSSGDVLALARTRDRLLQRLYLHGLSADRDLPAFLRGAGLKGGDRFRSVRDHIAKLGGRIKAWCDNSEGDLAPVKPTQDYIDLQFAFAMARLGETDQCRELLERARKNFKGRDEVHRWCLKAFEYRIGQSLEGKPHLGQLPDNLLQGLTGLKDRLDRYKIDRLRQHSRVLEPHEKIDPYRSWGQRFADELSKELALLFDVHDTHDLTQRLETLLYRRMGKLKLPEQMRVVTTALELSPRLGEDFSKRTLGLVTKLLQADSQPVEQAVMLERALFLAAHFDQPTYVQNFVLKFQYLLTPEVGGTIVKELSSLMSQSFRGLRKLGMRDDIAHLLDQLADLVEHVTPEQMAGQGTGEMTASRSRAEAMKLLLQVAGGWFYFDQPDRAWAALDRVRDVLMQRDNQLPLQPIDQTRLSCAYVEALAHAPVEEAVQRLDDLFRRLEHIHDAFTTNSHYSLSKLDVVESVVLALISDDFTTDKASRRWLDDDEFFVRRRIHHDVRTALGQAEM